MSKVMLVVLGLSTEVTARGKPSSVEGHFALESRAIQYHA